MGGSQKQQHTPMPGTPVFMPPEAGMATPTYNAKLDIFSYGNVLIHTITQVFPGDLLGPTYQLPNSGKIRGRSEVERRQHYFEILHAQLGKTHKLAKLTAACLADDPKRRPTAKQAMKILEEYCLELENEGKKYNAFSAIIIQEENDGGGGEEGGVEGGPGGEAMAAGRKEETGLSGLWDPETRRKQPSFIERHILVSR